MPDDASMHLHMYCGFAYLYGKAHAAALGSVLRLTVGTCWVLAAVEFHSCPAAVPLTLDRSLPGF